MESHLVIDAITGILKKGIRRNRTLTEFAQTLQFEFEHPPDGPVLLVHQMARVGSASVTRALRERYPRANVYRTHYLNPDTIRRNYNMFAELRRHTGAAVLTDEFLAARALERRLRTKKRDDWKVISLVRDPVMRTVSAFFSHFSMNHPQYDPHYLEDPAHVDRLVELFLAADEYERRVTLGWFDSEVRDVLGIDVFGTPFPRDTGFATYRSGVCRLLLLRLEDLDRVGPHAIGRFLGAADLQIGRVNRSDEAPYAATMAKFMDEIRLDDAYLDAMYGSRLARHFYSEAELAGFRQRWSHD